MKVLYHVDGKDPDVAKYAPALINKHLDAEGASDKIDVELVVHGPTLERFQEDKMDTEMTKRSDHIIKSLPLDRSLVVPQAGSCLSIRWSLMLQTPQRPAAASLP